MKEIDDLLEGIKRNWAELGVIPRGGRPNEASDANCIELALNELLDHAAGLGLEVWTPQYRSRVEDLMVE